MKIKPYEDLIARANSQVAHPALSLTPSGDYTS